MQHDSVTCEIRYKLDTTKIPEFEVYARAWSILIVRHGGTHYGFFLPRSVPDEAQVSFPQIGRDGPEDVAVALFSFPSESAYQSYRRAIEEDPDCGPAADLYFNTHCFLSCERLFLRRIDD